MAQFSCIVTIAGKKFKGVTIRGITVLPVAGLDVDIKFKVVIPNLAAGELEKLSEQLKNTAAVTVVGPKDLFTGQQEAPESTNDKPAAKGEEQSDIEDPTDVKKKTTPKKKAGKKAADKKPAAKKKVKPAESTPKKGAIDPKTINAQAKGKPTLSAVQ